MNYQDILFARKTGGGGGGGDTLVEVTITLSAESNTDSKMFPRVPSNSVIEYDGHQVFIPNIASIEIPKGQTATFLIPRFSLLGNPNEDPNYYKSTGSSVVVGSVDIEGTTMYFLYAKDSGNATVTITQE